MKSNIIFLDIDGVVNTLQISDKPMSNRGTAAIDRDGFYFDICSDSDERVSNKQAVMWLNKLCKDTNAKIVISSTWRLHGLDSCKKALYNSGLFNDIEIIGITPTNGFSCPRLGYWQTRETEILNWLYDNEDIVDKYVILDDDMDMGGLISYLVTCNTYHGFGYPEYAKALEILKK